MKTIGEYIVEQARSDYEAGYGEVGGDNRGPWILRIMRGITGAWCTGWVCTKIDNAITEYFIDNGFDEYKGWRPTYTRSARNLFNQFKAAGKLVEVPRPGDIIFMSRAGAPWMGHSGIVELTHEHKIITIEGNLGKYPSKLKLVNHDDYRAVPRLLGYGRVG